MKQFDNLNGLRITMKPPKYPCKVGLHINVSFGNEYELYVGSVLDNNNQSDEWQEYELPLNLLS